MDGRVEEDKPVGGVTKWQCEGLLF